MNDINSLAHTKWNCKYHIVFAPKYRRQVIYGKIKADIGQILRKLCEHKGIEIIEANACPEVQCVTDYGISQREKQLDDIRQACEFKVQVWQQAILVQRILCRYGGTE